MNSLADSLLVKGIHKAKLNLVSKVEDPSEQTDELSEQSSSSESISGPNSSTLKQKCLYRTKKRIVFTERTTGSPLVGDVRFMQQWETTQNRDMKDPQ